METMEKIKFKTVDEYVSVFPENVRVILEQLRNIIKHEAPEAAELISYNMPAFKLGKILVYYAAHKEHIGFYPANSILIEILKDELLDYETSKGAIQFPYKKPLPINLIKNIIRIRVKENLEKAKAKR
ncbi:MAG: hypothetical protein QG635_1645 [Bacteroidota bacterium]|nr:hypothetical protein [Bacteroidota bacterium]